MQRQLGSNTTLEVNYIREQGNAPADAPAILAQAFAPADPANPTPVLARRPYANFVTYIDSDWSGNSNYNSAM